jgi:hypothetical protein
MVLTAVAFVGQLAAQRQTGKGETMTTEHNKAVALRWSRFSDGKIVETWARDDLGTLRQLGHLPNPGGPAKR